MISNTPKFNLEAALTRLARPVPALMLTEAVKWLGTPYRTGGRDRNGVDAIGFLISCAAAAGLSVAEPDKTGAVAYDPKELANWLLSFCDFLPANSEILPGDILYHVYDDLNRADARLVFSPDRLIGPYLVKSCVKSCMDPYWSKQALYFRPRTAA